MKKIFHRANNLILVVMSLCVFIPLSQPEAKRKKRKKTYDCVARFDKVKKKFEKRRFTDVKNICNDIRLNCSGHEVIDSVIYYLAKAQMNTKNPQEAKVEFQQLIRDFPSSPFAEQAHYLIGYCSLLDSKSYERDQVTTKEAIRELSDFISSYPESQYIDSAKKYHEEAIEKLAKKEFMNARFYEKIDEFEAAVVYYKVIIEEFPNSKFIPEAKFYMAQDLFKVNRETEAKEVLEELLKQNISDEIRTKAEDLKARLDKSG